MTLGGSSTHETPIIVQNGSSASTPCSGHIRLALVVDFLVVSCGFELVFSMSSPREPGISGYGSRHHNNPNYNTGERSVVCCKPVEIYLSDKYTKANMNTNVEEGLDGGSGRSVPVTWRVEVEVEVEEPIHTEDGNGEDGIEEDGGEEKDDEEDGNREDEE